MAASRPGPLQATLASSRVQGVMFEYKMRFLILATFVLLQGCIVYPSKSINTPGFKVSIIGSEINEVSLVTRTPIDSLDCKDGVALTRTGENKYELKPKYSSWSTFLLLPADCLISVKICTVDSAGKKHSLRENWGTYCDEGPEYFNVSCEISQGVLSCANTQT